MTAGRLDLPVKIRDEESIARINLRSISKERGAVEVAVAASPWFMGRD